MARKARGRIFKRTSGGSYWLQYFVDGKEFRQSLRTKVLKEAEEERDRIIYPVQAKDEVLKRNAVAMAVKSAETCLEEAKTNLATPVPIDDAWQFFLKRRRHLDTADRTIDDYRKQWEVFVRWLKKRRPSPSIIREIKEHHANGFKEHLLDKNVGKKTINKYIRACRLIFKELAKTRELKNVLTTNPFDSTETFSQKKLPTEGRKELSWEKVCSICDLAQGEMKLLFFIGIYTGQRLGDCARLRWEQVDLAQGHVDFVQSKTSAQVRVPLLDYLRPLLEAIPSQKRNGFVMPEVAETYSRHRPQLSRRIADLFEQAGVERYKPGTGGDTGKRAVVWYDFHSLRHTTTSLLQRAGIPMAVIQAITGHKTIAMVGQYTHVGFDSVGNAMKALPAIDGGEPEETKLQKIQRLLDAAAEDKLDKVLTILESS